MIACWRPTSDLQNYSTGTHNAVQIVLVASQSFCMINNQSMKNPNAQRTRHQFADAGKRTSTGSIPQRKSVKHVTWTMSRPTKHTLKDRVHTLMCLSPQTLEKALRISPLTKWSWRWSELHRQKRFMASIGERLATLKFSCRCISNKSAFCDNQWNWTIEGAKKEDLHYTEICKCRTMLLSHDAAYWSNSRQPQHLPLHSPVIDFLFTSGTSNQLIRV